jgi:hypothetical protein
MNEVLSDIGMVLLFTVGFAIFFGFRVAIGYDGDEGNRRFKNGMIFGAIMGAIAAIDEICRAGK